MKSHREVCEILKRGDEKEIEAMYRNTLREIELVRFPMLLAEGTPCSHCLVTTWPNHARSELMQQYVENVMKRMAENHGAILYHKASMVAEGDYVRVITIPKNAKDKNGHEMSELQRSYTFKVIGRDGSKWKVCQHIQKELKDHDPISITDKNLIVGAHPGVEGIVLPPLTFFFKFNFNQDEHINTLEQPHSEVGSSPSVPTDEGTQSQQQVSDSADGVQRGDVPQPQ